MAKSKNLSARNQLRIIAGKWRGRKIQFPAIEDLRPTPDRIRETVFNWLQFDIVDKNCLDLFAGSGALGIEALSRGAENVTLVEANTSAIENLRSNLSKLQAENFQLLARDAIHFLQQNCDNPFNIIFLDPPYKMRVLNQCIELIEKNNWLQKQGLLYFEQPKQESEPTFSGSWAITRKKSAGNIHYYLAIFCAA